MIEEVVGSIIEAEDKAEQIRKEAKDAAKRLLSDAQKASDERRAAFIKECRSLSEEKKKAATEKAEKAYAEVLAQGKAEAEVLNAAYGKNVEKAVEAVISVFIG